MSEMSDRIEGLEQDLSNLTYMIESLQDQLNYLEDKINGLILQSQPGDDGLQQPC